MSIYIIIRFNEKNYFNKQTQQIQPSKYLILRD
jgi:hypothetical protein